MTNGRRDRRDHRQSKWPGEKQRGAGRHTGAPSLHSSCREGTGSHRASGDSHPTEYDGVAEVRRRWTKVRAVRYRLLEETVLDPIQPSRLSSHYLLRQWLMPRCPAGE